MASKNEKRYDPRGSISGQQRRKGRAQLKGKTLRKITVDIYLDNLSKSGVGFWLAGNYPAQIGDEVLLEFNVPGGQQIACKGKIMRLEKRSSSGIPLTNPVYVGAEFFEIPKEYKEEIEERVEKIVKRSGYSDSYYALDELLEEIGISVSETKDSLLRNWPIILGSIVVTIIGLWFIISAWEYGKTEWWKEQAKEWYRQNKQDPR